MMRALLITAFFAVSPTAWAQNDTSSEQTSLWEVCNETSFILNVVGLKLQGPSVVDTRRMTLRPGGCETTPYTIEDDRLVHAESVPAHQGGIREWQGRQGVCVAPESYTLPEKQVCENAAQRYFRRLDVTDNITTFIEPDNFGSRAETAGIQRLLRDNGYAITRIDGMAGRRTSRTLTTFLKDKNLPNDLKGPEAIDALGRAASDAVKSVGLKVCNEGTRTMWTAIGRRHRKTWASRGWWKLMPQSCVQPIQESLKGQDLHVFARMETEGGSDQYLGNKADSVSFCIADTRFAALGRDNCSDKGYESAAFRPLPNEQDGVEIRLSDQDFAPQNLTGLRK